MSDLQMLTLDQVATLLNVHRDTITMLRETEVLMPTKIGKGYMYSQEAIRRFQHDYEGLDVSNKVKALESKEIVHNRN